MFGRALQVRVGPRAGGVPGPVPTQAAELPAAAQPRPAPPAPHPAGVDRQPEEGQDGAGRGDLQR
jgi:hypothetical protein